MARAPLGETPERGNAIRLTAEGSGAEQAMNQPDAPLPRHRKTRKPFGSLDQKLAWPPLAGFHLYWFNDEPGRIDRAKAAGYEHVTDDDGKHVRRIVGVARDHTALEAYLMKLPLEWYQEDMAAEQKRVDEIDDSIRRGDIEGKALTKSDTSQKFYVGKQGISMRGGLNVRR